MPAAEECGIASMRSRSDLHTIPIMPMSLVLVARVYEDTDPVSQLLRNELLELRAVYAGGGER
eukprot:scaffold26384_cov36-Tisochrysis_lutea.AAC.10